MVTGFLRASARSTCGNFARVLLVVVSFAGILRVYPHRQFLPVWVWVVVCF